MPEKHTSQGKSDSPPYREIPPELRRILDAHRLWLTSGEKEGARAILANYLFQGLNLTGENLARADLSGGKFQGANLQDANLSQADLTGADFRDADLRRAYLKGSIGLAPLKLARANLKDCQLPEEQLKFAELDYVKDASDITSGLFTAMLLACVYTGITVFTTSDVALLTNSGTTTLPLLGVGISMFSFYFTAPLLLLAIYVYFQFNLQHLWESLANLPAVFPDGQRLDQRVYPWLFNWVPYSYFIRLQEPKNHRLSIPSLQKYLAVFFAWYFLPLTLILLWGRYLWVRDIFLSSYHLIVITVAVWSGFQFSYLAGITLRGENGKPPKRFVRNEVKTGVALLLLVIFADAFFYGVSYPTVLPLINRWAMRTASDFLQLRTVVNFEEKDVSTRLAKGDGQKGEQEADKEIPLARGAPLQGRDLRYAWAKGAFLARADLRHANLEGAYLRKADLRQAKLGEPGYPPATPDYRVKLEGAFLYRADLTDACLYKANLHRATLEEATLAGCDLESTVLEKANLRSAKLRGAILKGTMAAEANFQETILDGANLFLADFRGTKGLKAKQLKSAKNWNLALYDAAMLRQLKLPQDHNTRVLTKQWSGYDLQGADLSGADLTGADLGKVNLQGAKLIGAKVNGALFLEANLEGADLTGVQGFKRGQLEGAKIDAQTKLP